MLPVQFTLAYRTSQLATVLLAGVLRDSDVANYTKDGSSGRRARERVTSRTVGALAIATYVMAQADLMVAGQDD